MRTSVQVAADTAERVPSPPAAPAARWLVAACGAVLVLATVAAYHNTFRVPFLLDDTLAISENPSIRNLADVRHVLLPDIGYGITTSGRPLLNLSLALCYAVSGPNVWSYHALNLVIHLLAGLTLFGLIRRTVIQFQSTRHGTRRPLDAVESTFLAFAVGVIWSLHPLQTEAVTYVIQRTESLMGLFFLLTFYGFVRAVASSRPWFWRGLTVLACLAAVATKEVAATAPVLVLLYDRTFVAGTFRDAWRQRRWLHVCLAATWLPLAWLVAGTGWNRGGTAGFDVGVSAWAYWFTQFPAITRYLQLSLWPHPLIFEYGKFWMTASQALPYALVVLPLVAGTATSLWRWPVAGFLGAWFFVILAPTSVVPGTLQMIVEHRMYLPLAAVIAAVVFGGWGTWRSVGWWFDAETRRRDSTASTTKRNDPISPVVPTPAPGRVRARWRAPSALMAGIALAVPLGALTFQRNQVYCDDLTLWRQTVAERPASALAQSCLGTALYNRNHVTEAMEHYLRALRLDPGLVINHYNLALAYAELGQYADAIGHFRETVRINPKFYPGYYQLGLALLQANQPTDALESLAAAVRLNPRMPEAHYEKAVALTRTGRQADAAAEFETALRLRPDFVAAECDLGAVLLQLDQVPEAVTWFERALKQEPKLADAHFNLGLALARQGATRDAMAEYATAVQLNPNLAKAQYNLGIALGQAGDPRQALAHLRRAVELDPTFAAGHLNLAVALAMTGQPAGAVEEYESALRLDPNSPPAHHGLGLALLQLHRVDEARAQFEAALRIEPRFEPSRAALAQLNHAGDDH